MTRCPQWPQNAPSMWAPQLPQDAGGTAAAGVTAGVATGVATGDAGAEGAASEDGTWADGSSPGASSRGGSSGGVGSGSGSIVGAMPTGHRSVQMYRPAPTVRHAASTGEARLPGRTHDFRGADPDGWTRDVPHDARIRMQDAWEGIDVLLHGREGRPQYDFVVAPGGDPSRIAFDVEGGDSVNIDARGDLVVRAGEIEIRHVRPLIYQDAVSGRRRVSGRFLLESGQRVRFEVATHDTSLPLVIDPNECVGRRVGGMLNNEGIAVAAGP